MWLWVMGQNVLSHVLHLVSPANSSCDDCKVATLYGIYLGQKYKQIENPKCMLHMCIIYQSSIDHICDWPFPADAGASSDYMQYFNTESKVKRCNLVIWSSYYIFCLAYSIETLCIITVCICIGWKWSIPDIVYTL